MLRPRATKKPKIARSDLRESGVASWERRERGQQKWRKSGGEGDRQGGERDVFEKTVVEALTDGEVRARKHGSRLRKQWASTMQGRKEDLYATDAFRTSCAQGNQPEHL